MAIAVDRDLGRIYQRGPAVAASFSIDQAGDTGALALVGDWTATELNDSPARLTKAVKPGAVSTLDVSKLGRIDTSGLFVLLRIGGLSPALFSAPDISSARPDVSHLATIVASAGVPAPAVRQALPPLQQWLIRTGRYVDQVFGDAFMNLAFYGELLIAFGRLLANPMRLRRAPTISQIERTGLDAIPIIVAGNFFVGATIAFLGASLLAQFGASVFAVELVGVSVLREFAVLISAVILAGRSSSSFTAEIGAMKMNQEVDAMQVMGVDPFEGLVLPRFLAMLLVTPLLTVIAMAAGLAGGLIVLWPVLDLSPQFFLTRIVEHVGLQHFWIGMAKAPVMAVAIAAIGCRHGFAVGGDVEKLGRHVTASVVQALFVIITIDALFALMFMELNL